MIELRTLGGLELVGPEPSAVDALVSQPKRLALLLYLAAATPPGFHRRDTLLGLFWPELDQSHARGALRNALSFLRRQLGEAAIVTRGDEVALDRAAFWCDVTAFLACVESGAAEEALALYRGDLLEGFHVPDAPGFETWLGEERNHLRGRAAEAAWALATIEEQAGNWASAAGYARRAVALSAEYEKPACRLIELLDRAGDRGAALQEYQALEARLAHELEVRPSPETVALVEGIRARATPPATASKPPIDLTSEAAATQHTTKPAAPPRPRSFAALPRWAAAAGLAGLALAGPLLSGSRTDVPADPNLLAIAPFEVLDPALNIWREGLVDILSRSLDGAGPLHTVPQTVGLKRWRGRADRVSAESFGQRTGAGLVVFGNVRRVRDTVTLSATVLDRAGKRVEPDIEVRGDTAALGDLADSLGVRILQALGQNRPIGAVRQVSIGSRSLPALKAFLHGEQLYRQGLWDSALVQYEQAVAADSTFALAFRRMAYVLPWAYPSWVADDGVALEYKRRSVTSRRGLSPRDSLLLAADSFDVAEVDATTPEDFIRFRYRGRAIMEEAVSRYPGDPEMWLELGEDRFHAELPMGSVPGPALEAFDRAIALDPGFAPAYAHTVELAIRLNRTDLARRYADAYLRLDPTDVNEPSIRIAALLLDPERSGSPETARAIDSASASVLFDVVVGHLQSSADSGEAAIRVARALMTRRGGNALQPWSDTSMYPQFLANQLAHRGRIREAYVVNRRLLLDAGGARFSRFLDPFFMLAIHGVLPESLAAATFRHSFESPEGWPSNGLNTPRRLRGLAWWLERRDTAAIARFGLRAEQESKRQTTPRGKLRSDYLHAAATAYLALAGTDSAEALRLFQAISDTLCLVNHCFHTKLTEARLLDADGRTREAGAVLDRWIWGGGTLFGMGLLERGRISEKLGERQKAVDSYQFVADLWRNADSQLQPYVREARAGLERLAER
jgi:eukaryotic-like serine/threonine-protein kinase